MSLDHEATLARHLGNPRPGAMTAVMLAARPAVTGPRELRIGRVEAGAIVDDRRYHATVTFGSSERAVLLIPRAPRRCVPLFERSAAGAFTLHVPAGARGRVALDAGVIDLAGRAGTSIPLDASARGKLVLGETTLLLQMVPAAGAPLRPRLSSTARGGLLTMIDWRFTSYVVASLCAHLVFVAWLDSADFAIDTGTMVLPEQLTRFLMEMPEPPSIPDAVRVDAAQPTDEVVAREDATIAPSRTSRTSGEHGAPSTARPSQEDPARMAADAGEQARLLLVGALGSSGGGALDELRRGAATADAQALLDSVRSVDLATGPSGGLHSRAGGGSGSGESGTLGELAAAGHGATEQRAEGPAVREVRVHYTVTEPEPPIQQSGERDPEDVTRMLRARRQAFQACYEQRTRLNPELHGKIGAEFTISEVGAVSRVHLTENGTEDAVLGTCIASVFQRLRFGEVEGSDDSTFAHAFVFAPQH